jgi:hypothetical protein
MDANFHVCNQDILIEPSILDEVQLPIRPVKIGKQLVVSTSAESIVNKKSMLNALLDSGCTRTCIDEEYARSQGWPLQKVTNPIKIEYVDGSLMDQSIIKYSVDLWLRAAGATVITGVLVTKLRSFKMFLGFDWLQAVNPDIDWWQMKVTTKEGTEPLVMCTVQEGPGPTPDYVKLYPEVFSEEGFENLPPRWPWDHTIDLVEGTVPPHGKCYPLAKNEWEELKRFININQKAGKIQPSMSPFTSPFFFRPKPGTGELCGIQDYQQLNEITVKDCYPLPLISEVISRVMESSCFMKMDLWWGFNNVQI